MSTLLININEQQKYVFKNIKSEQKNVCGGIRDMFKKIYIFFFCKDQLKKTTKKQNQEFFQT